LPTSLLELRGAERPRVEYAPPAVDTLGDEAIDLAAAAGLVLEPWQADGLRTMLSTRSDGKWACFEYGEIVPRQAGKTALAMARALAGLFLLGERTIVWSAHEYRTAMRSFRDMRVLIAALGEVVGPNLIQVGETSIKVNNTNGEESFERLDTGQQIKLVARSKGAGRGFSIDCMVIDEAFAYTEQQQDALMPTLAARPNPQIIYASSPPLDGNSGDVMYSLRRRALKGDDETLGWRDWGLAMELDELKALSPARRVEILDDRAIWAQVNPALGLGRVSEESILRLRRSLSEDGFAREMLGMWPRQISELVGWQVIPEQPWRLRGGLDRERPTDSITFGLDASWPDAAFGAITVAGRLEDDDVSVQVIEHRPSTGWMVKRAIELDQSHPDAVFVLDKAGPAGHLLQELEAAGLEVMTPAMQEIARAFARFRAEVMGDEPCLRHYDQSELDDALKAASKRPLGDAFTWARQGEADISPLTAATMAILGVFEGSAMPWVSWG
jgi:hypothetical protein